MKSVIAMAGIAAGLVLAIMPIGAAQAADYPPHRRTTVHIPYVERSPHCWRERYAYLRYTPVLATRVWIRPVYIAQRVPCGRYG